MTRRVVDDTLSAPSAAAGNDVAVEKNSTAPASSVTRIALPSQPRTLVQTSVRSARGRPCAPGAQARIPVALADGRDATGEDAAGAGPRILELAAIAHDPSDAVGHARGVAVA